MHESPTKAVDALRIKIERLWKAIPYVLDPARVAEMQKLLQRARTHLDANEVAEGFESYYLARREHTLARSQKEIYYWRNWRGMQAAVFLLVVFVAAVILIFRYAARFTHPHLLLAIAGGGIGGCAAVLIQAIDVDPESEAVSKAPWYVIKPLLGGAFGLVTYLAIASGLALVESAPTSAEPNDAAVIVVGFLAGFFESFSKGVFARIAGQFTTSGRSAPSPPNEIEEDKSPT